MHTNTTDTNNCDHKITITVIVIVALTSVMGMQSAKKGPKGCRSVGLRKIDIPGCTNPTSND